MSDVADEELLNDEDGCECDYDLDYEEEEALLQDEEEEYDDTANHHDEDEYIKPSKMPVKNDKKEEIDEEPEDILNLDIEGEEDFQDVELEDKSYNEESEKRKSVDKKFSIEKNPQVTSSTSVVKKPIEKVQVTTRITNNDKTKMQNKTVPKNIKRKRSNSKNHYQNRANFARNNQQKERRLERRNGTVLINPRYQGVVRVENNARLAWDNPPPSQNNSNFIQPWASRNVSQNQLLNNLVSELISHQAPSNLLQLQQAPNNQFYQPPTNVYSQSTSFQTPNLAQQPCYNQPQHMQWDNSYNALSQNQVGNQQSLPQMNVAPVHHTYQPSGAQFNNSQYDSQPNYTFYNRPSNQQSYSSLNLKENFCGTNRLTLERNANYQKTIENDYKDVDYRHKDVDYRCISFKSSEVPNNNFNLVNDGCQNKNSNFGNDFKRSIVNNYADRNSNFGSVKYENKNLINRDTFRPQNYENKNNRNDYLANTNVNKNFQYNKTQQSVYNFRKTNVSNSPNKNNIQINNQKWANSSNFSGQRRQFPENSSKMEELPEKKLRVEDSVNKSSERYEEEPKKTVEQSKQQEFKDNKNIFEDEDEEMKIYKAKIEEQKRKREEVLRIKEERRKQMLLEKQAKEQETLIPPPPPQQRQKQQQRPLPPPPQRQNKQQRPPLPPPQRQQRQQPQQPPSENQIPPLMKITPKVHDSQQSYPDDDLINLSNLTFKVSNDFIKNQQKKTEPSSSSFMTNRVVIVKNNNNNINNQKGGLLPNPDVKTVTNTNNEPPEVVGQNISSFFNNRKVLKKDNSLIDTRLVVINNLSASTNQNKLVAMTRGIGEIQKLRMDKQERQATILFKSVASAHAFFKKYQRYMLDLSMIEVKLEPMI